MYNQSNSLNSLNFFDSLNISAFFLLLLFVVAGINKINGFNATVDGFAKVLTNFNITLPMIQMYQLIIILVIILEICGPAVVMLSINRYIKNKNYGKFAIVSLIVFTILATMLYHNPLMDSTQTMAMLKNLSIIGGFMLLHKSL